jgi:hypothetical protein
MGEKYEECKSIRTVCPKPAAGNAGLAFQTGKAFSGHAGQ